MKKLRIGHIAYTYKPLIGGAETYLSNLLDLLSQRVSSQRVYQAKNNWAKDKELKLVPVWKIFRRKPLYFYNILLNLYFPSLMKEDVLIVSDPFHFWPVFWHPHTVVISHGIRWDRPQKSEALYRGVHLASAKFAMKFAHKIVANDSNFYRSLGIPLKPKEGMFSEVVKNRWFIPNCVDTKIFTKTKTFGDLVNLNPILVPRNIVRGRGIHLALEAFKDFNKRYKYTNLVICGGASDPNYIVEIYQQIHNLNLIGKVYFLGSVNWKEMPKIYSSSLMSVIPTLYEEGTSLSALESMSCGVATLSTNVGGLPDLPTIKSSVDPRELAQKMVYVFKNRDKIAKEQLSEVRKTYNLKNFKQAWFKVIGE